MEHEIAREDWLLIADRWLESALAWAGRHNKSQTVASIRRYDETLAIALRP